MAAVVGLVIVFIAMVAGVGGFGWVVSQAKGWLTTGHRTHHVTVVHMPSEPGFPSVSRMQADVRTLHTSVPIRTAVVVLPTDDEADTAAADQSGVTSAVPGHPARVALEPIDTYEKVEAARDTVLAVQRQVPQLYDARTGDLRHHAMVLGVRPVSVADAKQYRVVSLVWGPTPTVEWDRGYSLPFLSDNADDPGTAC